MENITNGRGEFEWLARLKEFEADIRSECDYPHWNAKQQEAFRFVLSWLRERFPELGQPERPHREVDDE